MQAIYPVIGVDGAVDLFFNRPMTIDPLDGTQITLDDGIFTNETDNVAFGEKETPTQIRLFLQGLGTYLTPNIILNASPTNGLASDEDGTPWPGVTNLPLPFNP